MHVGFSVWKPENTWAIYPDLYEENIKLGLRETGSVRLNLGQVP
jgi:hypothetical protein